MATRQPGRPLQRAVLRGYKCVARLVQLNMDERKVEVNEDALLGLLSRSCSGLP